MPCWCSVLRVDVMRRAKEVKVINRWKATDFDGEIPIGGDDEEMLGTAMKMANGVGQLQGIVEDSMPLVRPMAWFSFYGIGGAVAGNTAMMYLRDNDAPADGDFKRLGFRAGYLLASGLGNLMANGVPTGIGEISRAGGVGVGSFLLAARRGVPKPPAGRTNTLRSNMLRGAIAGYTVAGVSYGITKIKERF